MPLYEYQCEACGNRFEKIVKFSDPPLETCPECGGAIQKLLSSPAIQFKGSGWYITDYAKKPSSDGSGSSTSDKGAGKSSETGETAKSDTKSDSSSSPAPATSKE
jgi:putative FmdB family regulatory protein